MNAFSTIEPANDSEAPAIGTACDSPGGGRCYVVAVEPSERATFTLFGGPSPMSRDLFTLTLASEAGHVSEVSENIAAPMIARARFVPPISEAEAADLWERAKVKRAENRQALAQQQDAAAIARDKAAAELQQIAPPWAVSAIVAELHEDASDSMSDYHNHRTARIVVIGWSKHNRDLFAEMRKFAATFPETADLADAPADAEHREKYSMGAGFYLKTGWRDCSGWCIKKRSIGGLASAGLEFSCDARAWASMTGKLDEPATPTGETEARTPTGEGGGRFVTTQHTHTKKGFVMWIASIGERVERPEYDRLLSEAKALGGWYSRPWGGTPGGFAFKAEANARAFVGSNGGEC